MTETTGRPTVRIIAKHVAWPFRRMVAPGALQIPAVLGQLERVVAELEGMSEQLDQARQRAERAELRIDALEQRLQETHEGLQESRLLNLRVAELTDVVTELVLPLHDREIDPEALRALRPETQ